MDQGRLVHRGIALAWRRLPGRSPTVVFLPGYRSDMTGDKAMALADLCAGRGQAMLRFDYSGHGTSGGRFTDGTVGAWLADTLAVIDALTEGALVLVGSSMGGWIGLLAALARADRVAAFLGIAAAPDFTEALMWDSMTPKEQATLMRTGVLPIASDYGEPLPITRALIEDGRTRLLLGGPIRLTCPVRLLHGQLDADVPWEMSLRLMRQLDGCDVRLVLVKDGDHRLSRPQDLALLRDTLLPLLGEDGG